MLKASIMYLFLGLSVSCGSDHVVTKYKEAPAPTPAPTPTPSPNPTPNPNPGKPSFAQMQALLVTYCQACHSTSPFMSGEAALRNSSAKDQIWSERMPPDSASKKLPPEERQVMLSFFLMPYAFREYLVIKGI